MLVPSPGKGCKMMLGGVRVGHRLHALVDGAGGTRICGKQCLRDIGR